MDELAALERARSGDKIAIDWVPKKYGEARGIDLLGKDVISKHKKEVLDADASAKKPKVGEVLRIDEEQSENHLNHNWKLLTVLPSGKLLIQYVGENPEIVP